MIGGLRPPLPYQIGGEWSPDGIARPWPADEYLRDGGDRGLEVRVKQDWQVLGLDIEDAVAHYDTLDGQTLVAPTGDPAWVTDLVNGDHIKAWNSKAAAVAGYPHITVPAGYAHGLPVGLSFFGRAWSEPTLIRLAYAFEQASAQRQPPQFLSTVDV